MYVFHSVTEQARDNLEEALQIWYCALVYSKGWLHECFSNRHISNYQYTGPSL